MLGLVALLVPGGTWAGEQAAEPTTYRMEEYRAPVPGTLEGATVIDLRQAEALWRGGEAVFVDVLPQPPRPDLPAGTLWHPPERKNIPGSLWLANTGFGALSPETEAYFVHELARATGKDKSADLVFYCLRDCWMSWNAAKRAVALGYSAVHWYPDGTDGWAEAGLPLKDSQPAPSGTSVD
ncbi:PQQ-dependent catabolism-associated CXXCW motif protein [Consotaella aegiceratis]|uniref:PQQ-dependent catabolism-associated CXXCW motif protein n=1 Tax=Consotaella aegiceratis TaxID=3097961 RepID=UPI003D806AAF